jgi:cytosine/adenosine deaminase-related metal-dependent hydrolase
MAGPAGHRALGWSDAGSIAVGKRADLTTIALDSIRTAGSPPGLALETAVFGSTASDVTSVVIDGVRRSERGQHVDLDLGAELDASIRGLWS